MTGIFSMVQKWIPFPLGPSPQGGLQAEGLKDLDTGTHLGPRADPLGHTASQHSSQRPPFCIYLDSPFSINTGFSLEVSLRAELALHIF